MATLLERLSTALESRYVLERQIGEGGMGVVFEGSNARLQSRIAIKVLRPELATAQMEASFLREARLLHKLSNPNIVTIHDVDKTPDGIHYYVMDFIEGETVLERLQRGPMDREEVLRLGVDLLNALETVHELNVVHRDIKPANIFLVEGRGVLVDFGIAHVDTTDSDATRTGHTKGTPAYMSPEQQTCSPVTSRTDLYAVGMVLYECVTGEKWNQLSDSDQGNWISVPQPLATALRKALRHDPSLRWPDALAFRAALTPARHYRVPKAAAIVGGVMGIAALALWVILAGRAPSVGEVDLAIAPFDVFGAGPEVGIELAGHIRRRLRPIPNLKVDQEEGPSESIATLYATGTLTRDGDDWDLAFTSVDSAQNVSYSRRFHINAETPYTLADSAAVEIVRQYFDAFRDRVRMPSHNIEALANWFSGEMAFQQDQWYQAERSFTAAMVEDPEFALAAWRLYNARQWGRRPVEIDLATLYRDNADNEEAFSDLDRRLIRAELEPDLESRLAIYDSTVRFHANDYYAALQRGNELFHRGPLTGRDLSESLGALGKAQRIEPLLAPSYNQTLWGTIRLGLKSEARGALEKRAGIPTIPSKEDVDASQLFRWAFYERFYPDTAVLFRQGVMADPEGALADQVARVFRIALSLDVPEAQIVLGRWMAHEPAFTLSQRRNGYLGVGLALIMAGRPGAGLAYLDSAVSDNNDARLVSQQARILLPLFDIQVPEEQRVSARSALVDLSNDPEFGRRAAWTLALDAWDRDASADLHSWRSRVGDGDQDDHYSISLSKVIEVLELGPGDPVRAIERSRLLTAVDSAGRGADPFVRALLYWHRAEWLEGLQRWREAEQTWLWYENSDFGFYPNGDVQAAEIDWVVGSYARLRRSQAQLGLPNRVGDACRHLRRVVELWADAEPDVVIRFRQEADSLVGDRCLQ